MNGHDNHSALAAHLHSEHRTLLPHIEEIESTADAVGRVPLPVLRSMVSHVLHFLLNELEPHAAAEDAVLYVAVERALGAPGAADTMRREHVAVSSYAAELDALLGPLEAGHEPDDETSRGLRRVLYGLHAVVSLHFAKEEELYSRLLSERLSATDQEKVLADLVAHAH